MSALFGFGFTQEDERTVASMLDVEGQTVLCVASGGDIPLSLLARGARQIIAVDISEAQLHLCRLKVAALEHLDPESAAQLLGLMPASISQRRSWMAACVASLPEASTSFWQLHEASLCSRGAIWCGRYERFIRKLQLIVRPLLGSAFIDLARCASTTEQELIFDRRIGRPWLRTLFRIAFSRKVYSGYGVDEQGLANRRSAVPLGEHYWAKLRSFCTATSARQNPWLQLHTIGRLLSLDAAPHYLGEGFLAARQQVGSVKWVKGNLLGYVKESLPVEVTRVFLSNLPDWCSPLDFEALVCELAGKLPGESKILWSCIHADWQLPARISSLIVESDEGSLSSGLDRFPFYAYTCARVAEPRKAGPQTT
jgi:S-adenosylmethionine-diacylglycerol 3-amino-3-carboxypropyl transferase